MLDRDIAMREFLALIKATQLPPLLRLRNCFDDEETFQELLQLQSKLHGQIN